MDKDNMGASLRDRATHEPSQQAVSAVPVSVPSAGQWAVVADRGYYTVWRIDVVTPKLIKTHRHGRRYAHASREDIVLLFDQRDLADHAVRAIESATAQFKKQRQAERQRHLEAMTAISQKRDAAIQKAISRIRAAQGIEAGTGETCSGSTAKPRKPGPQDAPND